MTDNDRALEVIADWLWYAANALSEFDLPYDPDCDSGDSLCPKCEVAGCIQMKIRRAKVVLQSQKPERFESLMKEIEAVRG